MDAPLVSILIPCFNAERFVKDSIESALGQDYSNIEVIVVDDGSTDGSLKVIRQYENRPNFRRETGPNCWGKATRNRLIDLAKGEFLQFLDANDLLMKQKISSQIACFSEDVDVVLSDGRIVDCDGETPIGALTYPQIDTLVLRYVVEVAVHTSSPVHRKCELMLVGGFDVNLKCWQEHELHYRLARRVWKKVIHVNSCVSTYRKVAFSISSGPIKFFQQHALSLRNWYDDLRECKMVTDEVRTAIGC